MDPALRPLSAAVFAAAVAASCYLAVRRAHTEDGRPGTRSWALLGLASLSAPQLILGPADRFAGDSFMTLTAAGRAGLALLSLVLALATMALSARADRALYRRRKPETTLAHAGLFLLALALNLGLFALFVWLSPQVFYLYYQILFSDLPWQWVVRPLPPVETLPRLLQMPVEASLSALAQGLLGRALLLSALAGPALAVARRRPSAGPAILGLIAACAQLLLGLLTAE